MLAPGSVAVGVLVGLDGDIDLLGVEDPVSRVPVAARSMTSRLLLTLMSTLRCSSPYWSTTLTVTVLGVRLPEMIR